MAGKLFDAIAKAGANLHASESLRLSRKATEGGKLGDVRRAENPPVRSPGGSGAVAAMERFRKLAPGALEGIGKAAGDLRVKRGRKR